MQYAYCTRAIIARGLYMLTLDDMGGVGVKTYPKHADVIYEWSLMKYKECQEIKKYVEIYEEIQFPTSRLEAENPFGLVY